MKKATVFLALLLTLSWGFADLTGCGESYIVVNNVWYNGSATAHTNFHGQNFGSLSSLELGGELQTWQNTFGVTAEMGYKISQGEVNHIISTINLPHKETIGSNDIWQQLDYVSVNISTLDPGVYNLSVWFHAYIGDTHQYDNNGGSDYVATFTIPEDQVPITLASFSAAALNGCVSVTWVTESETENDHFVLRRDGEMLARINGSGTTTEQHAYAYVDRRVEAGRVYRYELSDVSYGGVETTHDPVFVEIPAGFTAESFVLEAAYPNPFNPQATLVYRLANDNHVDLGIYDARGVSVATLFSGEQNAGTYEIVWNATDLPSGVYIVKMRAGDVLRSQKIVLMK